MARLHVNTAQVSAALRDAATTLKAAIVTSAAAILSQAKADLDANAAAALAHFDALHGKLNTLHDAILKESSNAAALAMISTTGTAEIDPKALNAKIAAVDGLAEDIKHALLMVVGSAERNGIGVFTEQVGLLGRAFNDVAVSAGEPAAMLPFQFDQLFLETMAELGQRDWSDGA